MRHLTPADYTQQPWKNGKGTTTEMWRMERDGVLLVRLSRASVVEDGPFSLFPGVERNLTVLTGPGFRLTGAGVDLTCAPLVPVAFPGDVAVTASGTEAGPSDDFNVMTARALPRPQVTVERDTTLPAGGLLALYTLGAVTVNGRELAAHDLLLTETDAKIEGPRPIIAARLFL
jgi:environmental stress-induced protein Ves